MPLNSRSTVIVFSFQPEAALPDQKSLLCAGAPKGISLGMMKDIRQFSNRACLACLTFLLSSSVFAEEAAKESPGFFSALGDNAFELTIVVIFLSAIIGAILRSRARDRALCDFQGYRVTLEFKGGKLVWGDLRVFPNGITLRYAQPHQDEDGHIETSTILYKDEFPTIQAIYRCQDDLTSFNTQRRLKDIERTYNPSIFRRGRRAARNAFNHVRDGFLKGFEATLGQMSKARPGSAILSRQKELSSIGKDIVQHAESAYDPILETLIGQKVVVEILEGDVWKEWPGILKDYTSDFIELLAVRHTIQIAAQVKPVEKQMGFDRFEMRLTDETLTLRNNSAVPLTVTAIEFGGVKQEAGRTLARGEEAVFPIDDPDAEPIILRGETTRDVDLVVPRAHARVRHRGEEVRFDWRHFFGIQRWTPRQDGDKPANPER
jgi:hypothetical protein